MKKVLTLVLVMVMTIPLYQNVAIAKDYSPVTDITIYYNNELVTFDVYPIIDNGRTLVPVRGLFEKMGATVDWNDSTRQVIVKDENNEMLLEIDKSSALINGELEFFDTKAIICNDRALIPLRFISESLGYDVKWDDKTRRIDITGESKPRAVLSSLPKVESKKALIELIDYSSTLNNYVEERFFMFMPDDMDIVLTFEEAIEESPAMTDDAAPMEDEMKDESAADGDYSGTNNQVDGVEEGDITKTDGEYIYYVRDNGVVIIDADPMNPEVVNTITVSEERGYINNLYVTGDTLVVLGTSWVYYAYPLDVMEDSVARMPYYNTNNTFMVTYDISDPSQPEIMMDMDFEGSLITSRMVGDDLYLVNNKYIDYWMLEDASKAAEYEMQPKYMDRLTEEVTTIDYDMISYFPDYIQPNYLMTIGIDLSSQNVDVQTYLGSAENVYANLENMYLTFTNYEYTNEGEGLIYVPNYKVNTAIYKFSLDNGVIGYTTEGQVPGTVVNQFSLDEHNGNLRIATTKGDMWSLSEPSTNNVFILDENLKTIGEVVGLAEGEKIYSTRFSGDRIYMVTFKQVDPFFVIDASDPTNPLVLGQLKIPGFSTYMHILDENHVLGFGKDTIDNGDWIATGGFKLSLFDVTDPTNPVEEKQQVIGREGTYSELEYNHKALMISLSKGIMGFPISVASEAAYTTDFVGAYVYDLSTDDFEYRGNISHQTSVDKYDYDNQIQRLLYIGDYIYTMSQGKIKVTNIETMEKVSELEF